MILGKKLTLQYFLQYVLRYEKMFQELNTVAPFQRINHSDYLEIVGSIRWQAGGSVVEGVGGSWGMSLSGCWGGQRIWLTSIRGSSWHLKK